MPDRLDALSPFGRIIALGYYDGPTSGVVQCSVCSSAYKYEIVAWDDNQDLRIYVLAPLREELFVDFVKTLSELEAPKWPVWVPRWGSASKKRDKAINSSLETLLGSASKEEYVLSTEDLSKRIIAAKCLDEESLRRIPFAKNWSDPENRAYWLSYLNNLQDSAPPDR